MQNELQRQLAQNENRLRDVNEAIEKGRWPGEGQAQAAFRCECGVVGCAVLVELSASEYERIRAHPRWFLLARDHEVPLGETVVEEHGGYVVVEKRGEAGRVAEATDPRA